MWFALLWHRLNVISKSSYAQWKDSQIHLLARTCTSMITENFTWSSFMISVKQRVVSTEDYHWTAQFDPPSKRTPEMFWLKVVSKITDDSITSVEIIVRVDWTIVFYPSTRTDSSHPLPSKCRYLQALVSFKIIFISSLSLSIEVLH